MKAVDVFAHAIKFMKDHIVHTIDEKLPSKFGSDVCYVITCPAIWSEQAKEFMRVAAMHVSFIPFVKGI